MHELMALTDQLLALTDRLTAFRMLEAEVSSKLEQVPQLDRILNRLFPPQFTTLTSTFHHSLQH